MLEFIDGIRKLNQRRKKRSHAYKINHAFVIINRNLT
jgi:hypothetical protein